MSWDPRIAGVTFRPFMDSVHRVRSSHRPAAWLPGEGAALPDLVFRNHKLRLERLFMSPEHSDGWARCLSREDLLGAPRAVRRYPLDFVSPTAFRRGDDDLPLPLPELVFGGYLRRARELFPDAGWPEELEHWILTSLRLVRHRIRTERLDFAGFVGRAEIEARNSVPDAIAGWLHCLAHLSFFLGTGRKTTMGMGMTRPQCCRFFTSFAGRGAAERA